MAKIRQELFCRDIFVRSPGEGKHVGNAGGGISDYSLINQNSLKMENFLKNDWSGENSSDSLYDFRTLAISSSLCRGDSETTCTPPNTPHSKHIPIANSGPGGFNEPVGCYDSGTRARGELKGTRRWGESAEGFQSRGWGGAGGGVYPASGMG